MEFGDDGPAAVYNLLSVSGMCLRVDESQRVAQHGDRFQVVAECRPVRLDVGAEGQSADNHRVGSESSDPFDQLCGRFAAVGGAFSRADDREPVRRIEVDLPAHVEHQRSVGALLQPLRIALVGKSNRLNTMLLHVFYLGLGRREDAGHLDVPDGVEGDLGLLGDVLQGGFEGCLGRPEDLDQPPPADIPYFRNKR